MFILRAPPTSYVHNVFTMPFPPGLWAASAGLVVLCSALMLAVTRAEQATLSTDGPGAQPQGHQGPRQGLQRLSGSDAVLMAIGAVCQQGKPTEGN